MESEWLSKELRTTGIIFLVLFTLVHLSSFWACCTFYASAAIFLSALSWWLATAIKNVLPRKRISPHKKAVLITGCDCGFGHELAISLFRSGYTVFAGCLAPEGKGATDLQDKYSSERMIVFKLDVTQQNDVDGALIQVKEHLQENQKVLWAVVNNAGLFDRQNYLLEFSGLDGYRREIEVNQLGPVRVTKAFMPLLRSSKGRVILVSSVAGRFSCPGLTGYCMTKHAITAFADGLRREMWKWGVKVITIEPYFCRTAILPETIEEMRSGSEVAWENADKQIRTDYGKDYFDKYVKALYKFMHSDTVPQRQVVSAMENAVTYEDPDPVNTVCGYKTLILLRICELLPSKLQDLAVIAQNRASSKAVQDLIREIWRVRQRANEVYKHRDS